MIDCVAFITWSTLFYICLLTTLLPIESLYTMDNLIQLAINIFDPFKIYRKYVIKPLVDVGLVALGTYKEKTQDSMTSARELILRIAFSFFAAAVIIWTAIFMYVAFYYAYMPTVAHMRPVYMQFQ